MPSPARVAPLALLACALAARAQDSILNPTRPTVANSASFQPAGVLQIETGYDAYPPSSPGTQQTLDTTITYGALPRLRLDLTWSAFNHQADDTGTTNGIGTIAIGGKLKLIPEKEHQAHPGFGIQYEATLPTAANPALQDLGQQAILLLNHHVGPSGVADIILNGSIVQTGCRSDSGCSYGGQQSLALSYHITKNDRLYAEAFAQNVSQSNTPPGTYLFAGFYHPLTPTFGIDGGLRFGVSDHSARFGTTLGLVFGRRLRGDQ